MSSVVFRSDSLPPVTVTSSASKFVTFSLNLNVTVVVAPPARLVLNAEISTVGAVTSSTNVSVAVDVFPAASVTTAVMPTSPSANDNSPPVKDAAATVQTPVTGSFEAAIESVVVAPSLKVTATLVASASIPASVTRTPSDSVALVTSKPSSTVTVKVVVSDPDSVPASSSAEGSTL